MRRYKRPRAGSVPPTPPKRRKSEVSGPTIVYHGNYCGPNYSAGKIQGSVADSPVPAIDELDQLCKEHDAAYANKEDLKTADLKFASQAWKYGLKGVGAAVAVGLQGLFRSKKSYPRKTIKKRGSGTSHRFSVLKTGFMPRRRYRRRAAGKSKRSFKKAKRSNKKYRRYRGKRGSRRTVYNHNKINAVTLTYEAGSSVDDKNCVFLGHAMSSRRVEQVLFMSMIRQLFFIYGVSFASFEEKPKTQLQGTNARIRLYWQFGAQDSTLQITSIAIGGSDTYFDLAFKLYTEFNTNFGTQLNTYKTSPAPVFNYLKYFRDSTDYVNDMAILDLQNMYVNVSMHSVLKMQNQTVNGGQAATTDVNNLNPLDGRVYYGKKNQNYFDLRSKYFGDETNAKYLVPDINGLIITRSGNHVDNYWKELVPKSVFGATSVKNFVLHPGQIVKDSVGFKKKIHISKLLAMMVDTFSNLQDDAMHFGAARVIGYDKTLFDRKSFQDTTVAYEIEQTYHLSLNKYNRGPVPYTAVIEYTPPPPPP